MRLVRVAAAAVLGVVVLAGCSDDETANDTLPEVSSSAAQTSETLPPLGPPDLPMPVEAREQTPAGAEAFIRYYMHVYTWAQTHMDATYMRQFSRDCDTCARIIREIEADTSAGYSYKGGEISVGYAKATDQEPAGAEAVFSITQAPLTVLDQNGQPVSDLSFPAHTSPGCGAVMTWDTSGNTWVLEQWDIN
jgi:hypothetical protein